MGVGLVLLMSLMGTFPESAPPPGLAATLMKICCHEVILKLSEKSSQVKITILIKLFLFYCGNNVDAAKCVCL